MSVGGVPYVICKILTGHTYDLMSYTPPAGPPFSETNAVFCHALVIAWVTMMCFVVSIAVLGSKTAVGNALRRCTRLVTIGVVIHLQLIAVYMIAFKMYLWPIATVCAGLSLSAWAQGYITDMAGVDAKGNMTDLRAPVVMTGWLVPAIFYTWWWFHANQSPVDWSTLRPMDWTLEHSP